MTEAIGEARRHAHHLTAIGFLLCFAASLVATLMHNLLDWPAPFGLITPPKLLGVPGGLMLAAGTAWLLWLKRRADPALGDATAAGGDIAFIAQLLAVALTGLALWLGSGSAAVAPLLVLHLACVLAFFLITPYSKMAHGFYRFAALLREAQQRRAG